MLCKSIDICALLPTFAAGDALLPLFPHDAPAVLLSTDFSFTRSA
jgi:hypothetical protein